MAGFLSGPGVEHGQLYRSLVGLPAALYRIRQDWAETMEACDLTVDPPMWRVMAARRGEGQIQPDLRHAGNDFAAAAGASTGELIVRFRSLDHASRADLSARQ